tara:strand:- start:4057 stop:5142 length:1086 start_codon:yes stop_codon:yes gene_type:complete
MNNQPELIIRGKRIRIIQGAMGVGVSGPKLTSAVANCDLDGWGTAGTLSGIGLSLLGDYGKHYAEGNRLALLDAIKATRERSPNGVIGVNVMHALTDYPGLVEFASKENIDFIVSGAGVPRDLPKLVENPEIVLGTIVSSVRFAKTMCKAWAKYDRKKMIVVEGRKAGGHSGFSEEQLRGTECDETSLESIVRGTVEVAKQFGNIPVFAAGGIYTGLNLREAESWGASGVQMGTRFVPTDECDAADEFKWAYLNAKKEDIGVIKSPVGRPGIAIINDVLRGVIDGKKIPFTCEYQCLKPCEPSESPYCIAKELVAAQQGTGGFQFAGTNAYRATEETCLDKNGDFITVGTLLDTIISEYNS